MVISAAATSKAAQETPRTSSSQRWATTSAASAPGSENSGASSCSRHGARSPVQHRSIPLLNGRLLILSAAGYAVSAQAQRCHREGADVTCDDGHRGIWQGDAIIWPDGTRSHSSPHPSVVIGNKSSVTIGPGVLAVQGKGVRPLDDPNKTRCVTLDEVPYCY